MESLIQLAGSLRQTEMVQQMAPPIQTALFLGALALLPTLLVCLTAYTRIVIVLSFARRAVTTQDIPPNLVIIGLALLLTLFVMGPTLDQVRENAIDPYLQNKITEAEAYRQAAAPFHDFMLRQTRTQDLALFLALARVEAPQEPADTPWRVLAPPFLISELKTGFIMGFCIYLPFLLVDLVVASILTALGMVTMPPVIVSAPFKILLFVLADGWHLLVYALSLSFT